MSPMGNGLVGSIALMIAVVALAVGLGPWKTPYELRTHRAIADRYGFVAARLLWLLIAAFLAATAVAILSGWRPTYAAGKTPSNSLSRAEFHFPAFVAVGRLAP